MSFKKKKNLKNIHLIDDSLRNAGKKILVLEFYIKPLFSDSFKKYSTKLNFSKLLGTMIRSLIMQSLFKSIITAEINGFFLEYNEQNKSLIV